MYCCYTNDNFLELPLSRYNTDAFQIIIKFTVRIIHNYLSLNITEIYLASQISFESSTLPLFSRISWENTYILYSRFLLHLSLFHWKKLDTFNWKFFQLWSKAAHSGYSRRGGREISGRQSRRLTPLILPFLSFRSEQRKKIEEEKSLFSPRGEKTFRTTLAPVTCNLQIAD